LILRSAAVFEKLFDDTAFAWADIPIKCTYLVDGRTSGAS
jgi:hypothetical protein